MSFNVKKEKYHAAADLYLGRVQTASPNQI